MKGKGKRSLLSYHSPWTRNYILYYFTRFFNSLMYGWHTKWQPVNLVSFWLFMHVNVHQCAISYCTPCIRYQTELRHLYFLFSNFIFMHVDAEQTILNSSVICNYSQTCFIVTTCLQRPPVYNKHIFCFPWKWFLIETCNKGNLSTMTTCLQRPLFVFPLGGRYRQVWLSH